MNAFLDYAEKNTSAAVKARQRAVETRRTKAAEKAAEKALAERDDLFRRGSDGGVSGSMNFWPDHTAPPRAN